MAAWIDSHVPADLVRGLSQEVRKLSSPASRETPVRLLLDTSSMTAVPHAVLDLAAAQADVFEHAIVHRRKLPRVATDAQFIANRGDQPRQVARRRQTEIKDRPLALSRGAQTGD